MGLAAPAPVSNKKGKEKEVDGDTVEVTQNPEDASARSLQVASDKGNSTPLVLVTTHKSVEALQFSSERGVMLKESAADDVVDESNDAAKVVETTQLSEEINGTHEYDNIITSHIVERENGGDKDYERENYSEDDDDDDDDGPSDYGDGKESIRKKLWTFFTT